MKGMSSVTGKDLIIYILMNNLENEEIFKDGRFIDLISEAEAAAMYGVGVETIRAWYSLGYVAGVKIGDTIYFFEKWREYEGEKSQD